jgi:hypothetical protein
MAFNGSVAGTGTIDIVTGGTALIQEPVAPAGLTFQLDGSATLAIEAPIGAGNMIVLNGDANTVLIDDQYQVTRYAAATPGGAATYGGGPPTVSATIYGLHNSDTLAFIDDSALGITLTSVSYDGHTLSLLSGTSVVSTVPVVAEFPNEIVSLGTPVASAFTGQTEQLITVACFAAGTRIATPRGAVLVEQLREGDLVATISGIPQPVQWIGRRAIDCRRHPNPAVVRPIRVAAHALGHGRPTRAVLLSPDHAVFVDDVLIPVKLLLNGLTVTQRKPAQVSYYHVELPRHDVVLADGLPVESYLETGGRSAFENGGGAVQLHPDFESRAAQVWQTLAFAPLVGSQAMLDRIRARMMWQAAMLGYLTPRTKRRQA